MLSRTFFTIAKKNISKNLTRLFCTKTEGLKNILKSEIDHEEKNYSPVDQADLKTFFQNSKFNFTESENSTRMELRKSLGNYEVVVNFSAKPPFPQEEAANYENEDEKRNI
jgi:hypothetical protein